MLSGKGCWRAQGLANARRLNPLQNCSTELGHQRCNRHSQSQEKHFQQQPGNRHWIRCFYKLQQTKTFGVFFPSDKLLKFADTDFCVPLQQLTQQWCSDHQISREVFLNGCIVSNSLFFLSRINHSIWTGGFSFNKPIIEKINVLQRIYRKLIIYEQTDI